MCFSYLLPQKFYNHWHHYSKATQEIWQMIILRPCHPPPQPSIKAYVTVALFERFTPKLNKPVFSNKNRDKSINSLDHYVYNIINSYRRIHEFLFNKLFFLVEKYFHGF